jgi:hypothetical protein
VLGAIGSDDQRLVPLKCTMANEEANGLETGLRAAGLDRRSRECCCMESQATRSHIYTTHATCLILHLSPYNTPTAALWSGWMDGLDAEWSPRLNGARTDSRWMDG